MEVLFARINPDDPTEVEFALNYAALGYSSTDLFNILSGLGFLDLRAVKGGPKDPQNFMWNDEYTFAEAGSPYSVPGTQNIYEADSLRLVAAPPVPEPGTWAMMLLGFGAIGFALRKRRSTLPIQHLA